MTFAIPVNPIPGTEQHALAFLNRLKQDDIQPALRFFESMLPIADAETINNYACELYGTVEGKSAGIVLLATHSIEMAVSHIKPKDPLYKSTMIDLLHYNQNLYSKIINLVDKHAKKTILDAAEMSAKMFVKSKFLSNLALLERIEKSNFQ